MRSFESDKGFGTPWGRMFRRYPRKVSPVAQSWESDSWKPAEALAVNEITQVNEEKLRALSVVQSVLSRMCD